MLIEQLHYEKQGTDDLDLDKLDALYKRARTHFDGDTEFADKARMRVVMLQAGEKETLATWKKTSSSIRSRVSKNVCTPRIETNTR